MLLTQAVAYRRRFIVDIDSLKSELVLTLQRHGIPLAILCYSTATALVGQPVAYKL